MVEKVLENNVHNHFVGDIMCSALVYFLESHGQKWNCSRHDACNIIATDEEGRKRNFGRKQVPWKKTLIRNIKFGGQNAVKQNDFWKDGWRDIEVLMVQKSLVYYALQAKRKQAREKKVEELTSTVSGEMYQLEQGLAKCKQETKSFLGAINV